MQSMSDDVRVAQRYLSRNVFFTLCCVLLVSLGVGILSSTFALVDAVVLRKLPLQDADRLVNINSLDANGESAVPRSIYLQMRDGYPAVSQLFSWTQGLTQVQIREKTAMASVLYVEGPYYNVMAGVPELGRLLSPNEVGPFVVLSDRFWRTNLGADPNVIGSVIRSGSISLTILGVTRPDYRDIGNFVRPDLTLPFAVGMTLGNYAPSASERYRVEVAGLLQPGVNIPQAQAQLDAFWPQVLQNTVPSGMTLDEWQRKVGQRARVWSGSRGRNWLPKELKRSLIFALGMAAILLITVCANVSGLILARNVDRQREFAIRVAVGASVWQMVRQSLAENLLLSAAAIPGALLMAWWGSRLGASYLPYPDMDYGIDINARVVLLAIALIVLTTVFSGLLPLLRIRTLNIAGLVQGGNPLSSTRIGFRKLLLSAQIAMSVLLLIAAGLFVQTIIGLLGLNLGFNPHGTLVFMITGKTPWTSASAGYFEELQDAVRTLPGVREAVLASSAPLQLSQIFPEDVKNSDGTQVVSADPVCVWPGFFDTTQIRFVEGRDFNFSDRDAVVLTEDLASQLFPQQPAVGRYISLHSASVKGPGSNLSVIGVVHNARISSPTQLHLRSFFTPCLRDWTAPETRYAMTLLVRTQGDIAGLKDEVRSAVEQRGKQFVFRVTTGDELVGRSMRHERMLATLSSVFGTTCLLLSAVGLYALIAFIANTREREMAIRLALGASRLRVAVLILGEILAVLLIGELCGLAIAIPAKRLAETFVFGAAAWQAVPIIFAILLMFVTGMFAAYWPVQRLTRIDPSRALHHE
jgi:putative ABC transport system permease protein